MRRRLRSLILGARPEPESAAATLQLDYPVSPRPRWGHGEAPHALITEKLAASRTEFGALLDKLTELAPSFSTIRREADLGSPLEPSWLNDFLPSLDAMTLYAFVVWGQPGRYMEIGSGESTKFVRHAIREHSLATRIHSVDPQPRAEIDSLCDALIRQPLEAVDLTLFDELAAGDILFFDGSHRVFTNSDVTVFFLEILPRLVDGVLVQIHDIYLPRDYPREWNQRYYSEQYLLAMALLTGDPLFDVVLPNDYVSNDPELQAHLAPLWALKPLLATRQHGQSFWLRTSRRSPRPVPRP